MELPELDDGRTQLIGDATEEPIMNVLLCTFFARSLLTSGETKEPGTTSADW